MSVALSQYTHSLVFFHDRKTDVTKRCVPSHRHWEANVLWYGFCSALDYGRLDSFLRRCVKLGYAGRSATVTDMFSEADDVFCRKIRYNRTHVLHSYLSDRPKIVYALRTRSHNKSLICKSSDLNDRNFLVRAIYKDCY